MFQLRRGSGMIPAGMVWSGAEQYNSFFRAVCRVVEVVHLLVQAGRFIYRTNVRFVMVLCGAGREGNLLQLGNELEQCFSGGSHHVREDD